MSNVGEKTGNSRNTREVLAIRLSPAERVQVAKAARLQNMTLSGYVRAVSLQSSAVVTGRAVGRDKAPSRPPDRALPVLDLYEQHVHLVDGEPVRRG